MQEVLEKIKEKIGDEALEHAITGQQLDRDGYYVEAEKEYIKRDSLNRAIDIVNQVTEKYRNNKMN